MQSFELTTTSRLHYVLFLLTGIFTSVFTAIALLPKNSNQYLFLGLIIGLSFLSYWIAEKYSKQIVSFSIAKEYLHIQWVKPPLFSNKRDRDILWGEIDSYVHQKEKDFDLFKLVLAGGEKLKFSISHDLEHQESFHQFYQSFLNKVNNLGEQEQASGEPMVIKQGKTFYETPLGIGLAFVLAGAIVFAIIFSLMNQDKRPIKWGKLLAAISACVFYIQLVWTYNKKKKVSLV